MVEDSGRFDALLQEDRTFPPSEEFTAQANIADPSVYEQAARDPEAFGQNSQTNSTGSNDGTQS